MDVDYSKFMPIRATMKVGLADIQTRYSLMISDTHVTLTFPDAKGLRLVLSPEELKKLSDVIQARKEGLAND